MCVLGCLLINVYPECAYWQTLLKTTHLQGFFSICIWATNIHANWWNSHVELRTYNCNHNNNIDDIVIRAVCLVLIWGLMIFFFQKNTGGCDWPKVGGGNCNLMSKLHFNDIIRCVAQKEQRSNFIVALHTHSIWFLQSCNLVSASSFLTIWLFFYVDA